MDFSIAQFPIAFFPTVWFADSGKQYLIWNFFLPRKLAGQFLETFSLAFNCPDIIPINAQVFGIYFLL